MKIVPALRCLVLLISGTGHINGAPPLSERDPTEWVDPMIGTASGRWFFFAPAARPFGMVKLAPDTRGYGGYAGGGNPTGYRYSDTTIHGFSHLHDFQLGGVLLMPSTGPLVTIPGQEGQDVFGWRSRYSKSSEHAEPGYYSVTLDKYNIRAELTATMRVGLHRYTYPKGEQARILIDIGHPQGEGGLVQTEDRLDGAIRDAMIEQIDDQTLRASATIYPPYLEHPISIYTEIRFDRPYSIHGAYRNASIYPGRNVITGFGSGFYVEFDTNSSNTVEARVALSFVSCEQAAKNLNSEVGIKTFNEVRGEARGEWNVLLGRVKIHQSGENVENVTKFYTALWHVLLGRGVSSDADGSYLDSAGRKQQIPLVRGVPEFARYNTDALWGSFWNLNQVWSLLYPEQMTSFAKFLLNVYSETGWLTDGYAGNQRAPGMLSNQATPFLAAAFARNPKAFDSVTLWKAIAKNQGEWRGRPRFTGQESLQGYSQLGYAPCDDLGYGATSNSLEYAYEDWCAAQVALGLGKSKESHFFIMRSESWRKLWDDKLKCFRPRRYDGEFNPIFDINGGFSFAEGTARQYRWFVPHDIGALIRSFGAEYFIQELDQTLSNAAKSDYGPTTSSNVGGYVLGYNHGNQPDLHVAWLFHFAGHPELTEKHVRQICNQFYGSSPEHGYGRGQDEDQGQLGAWYVLASLGLFDVEGMVHPDAEIAVIPPAFKHVSIFLPSELDRMGKPKSVLRVDLPMSAKSGEPIHRIKLENLFKARS